MARVVTVASPASSFVLDCILDPWGDGDVVPGTASHALKQVLDGVVRERRQVQVRGADGCRDGARWNVRVGMQQPLAWAAVASSGFVLDVVESDGHDGSLGLVSVERQFAAELRRRPVHQPEAHPAAVL